MDAFAVAVCKGLGMRRATPRKMVLVGLYFGLFQAGMPLVGYFVGVQFSSAIRSLDHWIAFGLLSVIGVNMLKEAVKGCAGCSECDAAGTGADLSVRSMTALAVATSIDALAVGVGFAFLNTPILPAAACIGIVAFFSICFMRRNRLCSISSKKFSLRSVLDFCLHDFIKLSIFPCADTHSNSPFCGI